MPKRELITAKSQFIADSGGGFRARVPSVVRDKLGARVGDKLVFEEGTTITAERAALRGTYFIVRLEPECTAVLREDAVTAPEQPHGETVDAPYIESLAEAVRRKQRGE
jgi:bifunctional DNA-binding transcriptional regulator/antitoxin component of YhaV-PrlF toxin-antitoxin module